MKIIGVYCATMGDTSSNNAFMQGVATIRETATTWRISFHPYGFEYNTAEDWVYKKRSKKERTCDILPVFWKEYVNTYNRK